MRAHDLPFDEQLIRLDVPETRGQIASLSPSGLVPCLKDGDHVIWDSLAIAEYLAEKHPGKHLWPEDPAARTLARCISAEMHSGFSGLRTIWPMDIVTEGAGVSCPWRVRQELTRIFSLWSMAREHFGQKTDEPYLFGGFTIADAFYAPVVSRIRTYGPVSMPQVCADYMEAIWAHPAIKAWCEGAREEAEAGWYA